jgi:lipopolysaccharide heptosyltransferase I
MTWFHGERTRFMTPLPALEPRRIALIKPSALGDIVHSLPVLCALCSRFPDAHITWVVNRSYEPLLRKHVALDATLPFDRGATKSAVKLLRFARRLRAGRFDLVIDLQGLLRTGLMAAVTGAARRIGLSSSREGASFFYTDVVPDDWKAHAVDRYWRVAAALGAGDGPKRFDVPLEMDALAWADRHLVRLPRPWLVFAVGARWLTKRWPPEHFAALGRDAMRRAGGSAVFVGSGEEAPLAQRCAALLPGPTLDLSGRTILPQLAAILNRADVVLANDSGPLHLAAALGRPVIAPYTCTDVRRHGPYGADGAVATMVACRASYVRRCDHLSCMSELTPDRLWPRLAEVLPAWPQVRPARPA